MDIRGALSRGREAGVYFHHCDILYYFPLSIVDFPQRCAWLASTLSETPSLSFFTLVTIE